MQLLLSFQNLSSNVDLLIRKRVRQGLPISPSSFAVAKHGETRWRFGWQHCSFPSGLRQSHRETTMCFSSCLFTDRCSSRPTFKLSRFAGRWAGAIEDIRPT